MNTINKTPIISVKNLVAKYGEVTILNNLTFDVNHGDIFVILGTSGCGKSTLMRHMVGLNQVFSGNIEIDGIDITTCNSADFEIASKNYGILFQGSALFGSMTLAENVALPLKDFTDLPSHAIDSIVKMKLHMVGLSGFENHLPSEISGGMKKRAGLARALALNPKILFLDEPSAGLDPVISAGLDELILQINKSIGTTLVIVTHELESIFTVASRAIMLDKVSKGIIAEGHPKRLKEESSLPAVQNFFNRRAE